MKWVTTPSPPRTPPPVQMVKTMMTITTLLWMVSNHPPRMSQWNLPTIPLLKIANIHVNHPSHYPQRILFLRVAHLKVMTPTPPLPPRLLARMILHSHPHPPPRQSSSNHRLPDQRDVSMLISSRVTPTYHASSSTLQQGPVVLLHSTLVSALFSGVVLIEMLTGVAVAVSSNH